LDDLEQKHWLLNFVWNGLAFWPRRPDYRRREQADNRESQEPRLLQVWRRRILLGRGLRHERR